jgi:cell division protein FtsL
MFRLNAILLILIVISALAVVTIQHKAREYYGDFEREKKRTQELETEYGQLLLEQSTCMMSARIEEMAINRLGMIRPEKDQIEPIVLPKSEQIREGP